jgi:hypothetical protein
MTKLVAEPFEKSPSSRPAPPAGILKATLSLRPMSLVELYEETGLSAELLLAELPRIAKRYPDGKFRPVGSAIIVPM